MLSCATIKYAARAMSSRVLIARRQRYSTDYAVERGSIMHDLLAARAAYVISNGSPSCLRSPFPAAEDVTARALARVSAVLGSSETSTCSEQRTPAALAERVQ